MALAYAITRTISSHATLLSKVCSSTYKCSFSCGNVLNKKLSIAEELNLPEPPTKPQQPFVKFMSMGHKELTNFAWSERVQKLSAAWNNQTQEEKTTRLEEYYEEKKEYQQKYRQYLSQLTPEQLESIKTFQDRKKQSKETTLAKKEKKKELERLGKPKLPENCFFVFAYQLQRPEDLSWKGFLGYAASKWKELPEAERTRYKNASRVRAEKYEAEMAVWEKKMLAAGRSELVRRRTYQVYQTSDNKEQWKTPSRSKNDDVAVSKSDIPMNNRQETVESTQESTPSQAGVKGSSSERSSSKVAAVPESSNSKGSYDTIILKRRTNSTKSPASAKCESLETRKMTEEYFPSSHKEHLANDSAFFNRSFSSTSSDTISVPQRYATFGTRPHTQKRSAMFAAAFPED